MVGKGKRKIVEAKDRLSTLPDEVLCHILSFLITIEAVSTSVLSTRWRNLYTYVTVLQFWDHYRGTEATCGKFAEFIKGVFYRHVSDISFFRLVLASGPYDIFDVVSWINASIRRNVQKLKVTSVPEAVSRCPVPTEVFTCKTLVDLKLWGSFVFNVPETVYLPNLKKCFLCGSIEFVNKSSGRLFLSFPKLEKLTLINCNLGNILDLELHLPLVQEAHFSMVYGDGANKILLDAPNIERIRCYYHMASVLFKDAVKFICRADVGFNQKPSKFGEEAMDRLLEKINQVKYLSLCMDLKEIWLLPMFNNLTHLVLKGTCKWLPELLHRSPCLEVLVILEGFIDDDVDAQISECEPLCLSRQLKVVKVNATRLDQAEFKSVGFLLKNAKVLERLIVYLKPLDRNKGIHSFERRCQILEKLLALPRESKTCQVEITDKYFNYGHMS